MTGMSERVNKLVKNVGNMETNIQNINKMEEPLFSAKISPVICYQKDLYRGFKFFENYAKEVKCEFTLYVFSLGFK